MVVYEMSKQVFPTAPSPTTTHLDRVSQEGEDKEGGGLGKEGRGRGGERVRT